MKLVLVAAICILALPGSNAQSGLTSTVSRILGSTGLSSILTRVLRPVGELLQSLGHFIGELIYIIGNVVGAIITGTEGAEDLDKAVMEFKQTTEAAGGLAAGLGSIVAGVLRGVSSLLGSVLKTVTSIYKALGIPIGDAGDGGSR